MTGAWCFPDEQNAYTEAIFDILGSPGFYGVAPQLWAYEVRNTVLTGQRRGRITTLERVDFFSRLHGLNIRLIEPPSYDVIFTLAEQHNLTFYDAAYLSLAMAERFPLASLDKALIRAAAILDIEIFHPPGFLLQ